MRRGDTVFRPLLSGLFESEENRVSDLYLTLASMATLIPIYLGSRNLRDFSSRKRLDWVVITSPVPFYKTCGKTKTL